MGQADYQRVLDEMRLAGGHLFSIPITLPVEPGPDIHPGREVALRNSKNELLAVMTIDECYGWDRAELAQKVFGSQDTRHPLVAELQRCRALRESVAPLLQAGEGISAVGRSNRSVRRCIWIQRIAVRRKIPGAEVW